MSERRNNKKQKKKKKKKFRKLFISTVAFVTAAVIVVFCIYYVYFETPYFEIVQVDVSGNLTYDKEYIIEKSDIELGERIFSVDREKVKERLEKEVYVESARAVYELPDRIYLDVKEREEKYQIFYNNEYIITDKDGIALKTSAEKIQLLTIESLTDVLYNIGNVVEFSGIADIKKIFDTIEYLNSEFGSETINGITAYIEDSVLIGTEYGTLIRIKLDEDIKYQVIFAMKIINERLNNNLTVTTGLIDFTKGDSPVYIEDFKMEEYK